MSNDQTNHPLPVEEGGVVGYTEETTTNESNKWSKNAYGDVVVRQRHGKFSEEESEIVRKAVEDYCAMKQVSVARLCSECDHKAELKGAWMEISKRLPHRSVQSVYRHGLRQLHPFKRGTWTDEECELLNECVHRMGKKWAVIQTKLNRSADSCRDKYREMNDDYVRGRWKESESEELKKLIKEHLNVDPNSNIKEVGKMVQSQGIKIPWSAISKRMGKRSRLSCFKKWQKMTGIHSPSDQSKKSGYSKGDKAAASGEKVKGNDSMLGGNAAASIVSGVNNPIRDSANADFDIYLLAELSNLNATRTSDINWDGLRLENAQERWLELFEEFQSSGMMDESMMTMPISEIAQLMLERKTSAQRAAETVEAVDLPPPEALNTREI